MKPLLYDILKRVFVKLDCNNFVCGKSEVITTFKENDSVRKDSFPCIIAFTPFSLVSSSGEFIDVSIPKIVIANNCGEFEKTEKKYLDNGNFKSVLYPIFENFLKNLVRDKNVTTNSEDELLYELIEIPSMQSELFGSYFYDSLEIRNLNFKITKTKKC